MSNYNPKPENKLTFGLWTVGNIGRDPFGGPVREQKSPSDLVRLPVPSQISSEAAGEPISIIFCIAWSVSPPYNDSMKQAPSSTNPKSFLVVSLAIWLSVALRWVFEFAEQNHPFQWLVVAILIVYAALILFLPVVTSGVETRT